MREPKPATACRVRKAVLARAGFICAIAVTLAAIATAPAVAAPGQQVELAPYTETQRRKAWVRETVGTCPSTEIHRRTLNEVFQAACPGPPYAGFHHWEIRADPLWGDMYCTDPVTLQVFNAGPLNDACGSEGESCEVPFPGFVGKGSLPAPYCEKVTTRCPRGYDLTGGKCVPSRWGPGSDKAHRCEAPPCGQVGSGIDLYFGTQSQIETDYRGIGAFPLRFDRFYNSPNSYVSPLQADLAVGALGKSPWSHTYSSRVAFASGGGLETAYVWRPDGKVLYFTSIGGVWTPDADVNDRLERLTDGSGAPIGWRLVTAGADLTETYDGNGRLQSIANRAGLTHTLSYNPDGQLTSVSDGLGRSLVFAYNLNGFIATMTDPAGSSYQYAYLTDYRLASVSYPASGTRTYHYEHGEPLLLTGITAENGNRLSTYAYDGYLQAQSSELAGVVQRYTVTRPTYAGATQVTVTDPRGTVRTYNSDFIMGAIRTTSITGPACPQCGPAAMTYDMNGNISSVVDWNGRRTCRKYDLARNLEVARGEGLTGSCPADLASWGPSTAPGSVERKVTSEWHASWRLPTKICEPKRITSLDYDAKGNLTSRTEQATSDAQGAQGCGAPPVGAARTWTYSYVYGASNPAVATQIVVNGPRTDAVDTTTYVYQESTGNLLSVTNALGHQTALGNYDAHGKPREITDPNGLVTTLVWDNRQRLTSRTAGSQVTGYTYDNAGLLTRITFPDGGYLEHVYDNAQRLTEVRDNLGNKVTYTLDAMGNRTLEETRDAGGTLRAKRSREYSNLNRLLKDIGGTNPTTQVTQYGYDNQGNLTSIDGPLAGTPNDLTVLTYDALNRPKDSTDPLSGITRYTYDGLDRIVSVQDPRSNTTSYTTSGLGDQTQEVSPDRGSTNRLFDAAGNLTSSTDARGKVTTQTFDALNRLTQTTFQGADPITYAWDQGSAQKGRLTTVTFTGGNTTYTYDPHGRTTQKRDTHSTGRVFTVGYSWNATNGRLASMTYPGGKVLTLGYDTAGRVTSLTVGSAIIANNIAYFPFGPPSGWTWGNSQVVTRTFDLDGRLTSFPLTTTDSRQVIYDDASRITQIKHPTNAALIQTMAYDKLDRLTSWADASSSRSHGYDANGNRSTLTIGGNSYTYTTPATSNRLASTSGPAPVRTFTYDAAGNATADGQFTLTFNDRGRVSQAVKGSTTATYTYDGMGQRVKKTGPTSVVPSGTNYFVYDEQGKLLGEYNSSGAVIQEYVWLGTMPIAVLRGTTASPTVFYVYADQIDRPWVITNTANQIRWRWDTSPFGELPANQNPAGLGNFAFNLRFPGQYRDAETGLFYNTFRDYDPQTGRYVQSDPIGLAGGINPYLYGRGSPLSYVDPLGLETAVIYGRPSAGNPFGHVAIAFSGEGVYSFGTSTPLGSSLVTYLSNQASYRGSEVLILNTTPAQERRMIEELRRMVNIPLPDPRSDILGAAADTCAVRTGAALSLVGIRSRFASSTSPYPADIAMIAGQHAVRTFSIARGGSVPSILGSFNPLPYFP
jgi:RHS repeat-associated protein